MNETITAHADPVGETPWAMQIVVHVPKADPPIHPVAVLAAGAAVPAALARFETDPDTAAAVDRWRQGRIRKVVRRARGAAWERSNLPDAHTHDYHGVRVRVFPPAPVDQVPAELAKLQVSGLALHDVRDMRTAEQPTGASVAVYTNPHLPLTTGKEIAQVAHATQLVYEHKSPQQRHEWADIGYGFTLRIAAPELWEQLRQTAPVRITDAGFTEIPPGTETAIAVF